jgi:uncharacterized protein YcfJ
MNIKLILLALFVAMTLDSCVVGHPDPYVRHGRRSGAVTGAVVGGVIGHNVRGVSKWEGAAAGAVVGGLMGDARGKANSAYYGGGYGYRRRPYYGYY